MSGRNQHTLEPGGRAIALKHGAGSPRVVAHRTEAIVAEWLDPEHGLPLSHPVDRHAVWATAAAYARLQEMTAYLEGVDERGNVRGAVDARGRPRGVMYSYWTAYRATMSGLAQLGATPAGRSAMAGDLAAVRRDADNRQALQDLRQEHAEGLRRDSTP